MTVQVLSGRPALDEGFCAVKRGLSSPATLAAVALRAVEEVVARYPIPNDLALVRSFCSQFAVLSHLSQRNDFWDYYNMRHMQRCVANDGPIPSLPARCQRYTLPFSRMWLRNHSSV